jgi:hypothetical protein
MISQEKMKILEMIENKKVNAEQAAKLLEALEQGEAESPEPSSRQGRSLKIKVSDKQTGAVKVNVGLPIGIARFFKDLIPAAERARMESQGIDLDLIFASLNSGSTGKLLDVEDEEQGQVIEIWIE